MSDSENITFLIANLAVVVRFGYISGECGRATVSHGILKMNMTPNDISLSA